MDRTDDMREVHLALTEPAPKLGAMDFRRGLCSCGWRSGTATTDHDARKNAQAHCDAKNAANQKRRDAE